MKREEGKEEGGKEEREEGGGRGRREMKEGEEAPSSLSCWGKS